MTPTWASVCLVATALSCLADAQTIYQKPPQEPPIAPPVWPPRKPSKPPMLPPRPQPPQIPQIPQNPQVNQWKPVPQLPQVNKHPIDPIPPPVYPQNPWKPVPPRPQDPELPKPKNPQVPQWKPVPQNPQVNKHPIDPPPVYPQNPWKPVPQIPQVNKHPIDPPPVYPVYPQKPSRPETPTKPQRPMQQPGNTSPPDPDTVQSCEVEEAYKIKCGPQHISPDYCGAINCCYDGRMCFYGKAVTVQCTKDAQFIVVVARDATLPNIDLESVFLLGNVPGCGFVGSNSRFAIYQFPVTGCGSVIRDEPGVVVYENRMSSLYEVEVGPFGSITRDSKYELLFQCRYIGTTIEALVIEVVLNEVPQPIAALGIMRVDLMLGNGVCTQKGCYEEDVAYDSFYTAADYPVVKVLRAAVYVQVQLLGRNDPSLILTLGRCWATTTSNPASHPQWDLLTDGCPYRDDRYQTALKLANNVAFPSHYQRFVFKMFTFVDQGSASNTKGVVAPFHPLREKVFIHCTTAVCIGANCQPRCSRKKRDAGKATQRYIENTAMVSSMEIQFVSGEQAS
ncbi:unnamed protein product [Arctogadus glacialis]